MYNWIDWKFKLKIKEINFVLWKVIEIRKLLFVKMSGSFYYQSIAIAVDHLDEINLEISTKKTNWQQFRSEGVQL